MVPQLSERPTNSYANGVCALAKPAIASKKTVSIAAEMVLERCLHRSVFGKILPSTGSDNRIEGLLVANMTMLLSTGEVLLDCNTAPYFRGIPFSAPKRLPLSPQSRFASM